MNNNKLVLLAIIAPCFIAWGLYIIADNTEPTIIIPPSQIQLSEAEKRILHLQQAYTQAEEMEEKFPIEEPMKQIKLPIIDDIPRETDFIQSPSTVNRITLHHTVVFDDDPYKVAIAISRNHEARWVK